MLVLFGAIFTAASLILMVIAYLIAKINNPNKKYLLGCIISSAAIDLSYMVSILTTNYLTASVFSSIYFFSVDCVVLFFFRYIINFTNNEEFRLFTRMKPFLYSYALVDFIILMINPFFEITVHFSEMPAYPGHYEFTTPYPALFWFHLIYTYFMICCIFFVLIKKILQSPGVYRRKYSLILAGLFVIVLANAVFLYMKSFNLLDFSILFYGIQIMLMYFNEYHYSERYLLAKSRNMILDEISTPIILFDYEDRYATANGLMLDLLGSDVKVQSYTFPKFFEHIRSGLPIESLEDDISFTSFFGDKKTDKSYHCDFRILRDSKNAVIGKLFIFSKITDSMDYLTGFDTKQSFERHFSDKPEESEFPLSAAVFDINRLGAINEEYGHDVGDKTIQLLSRYIRRYCPTDSYFARLDDANLAVICRGTDAGNMRTIANHVVRKTAEDNSLGFTVNVQAAVSPVEPDGQSAPEATKAAEEALSLRKLMDFSSERSTILNALIQVQQENDSDTTAHVRRTHLMGQRLGERLGLSDSEQSALALLCILHDIGKLGIPFEVLNKPGKLTEREWELMRSHVHKGYRIAKSAAPLENLADLILHHHESWDGTGYPDKLKGEEIPLLLRIITLVDTYDAMTNDRVYRKAMPKSVARSEIKRLAGIQFDPLIAEKFLKMLEEIDPIEEPIFDFEIEDASEFHSIEEFSKSESAQRVKTITYSKYYLDSNNMIISVDGHFTEMTGYTEEDVKNGLYQDDLIPPEDRDYYSTLVDNKEKNNSEAYIRHRILCKDGATITVNCFGKMFFDPISNIMTSEIVITYSDGV